MLCGCVPTARGEVAPSREARSRADLVGEEARDPRLHRLNWPSFAGHLVAEEVRPHALIVLKVVAQQVKLMGLAIGLLSAPVPVMSWPASAEGARR